MLCGNFLLLNELSDPKAEASLCIDGHECPSYFLAGQTFLSDTYNCHLPRRNRRGILAIKYLRNSRSEKFRECNTSNITFSIFYIQYGLVDIFTEAARFSVQCQNIFKR